MNSVARTTSRITDDHFASVQAWLDDFAAAVRAVDFSRGRQLFHENVIAFGTRGRHLHGLAALEQQQWRHIWPVTRNFCFDTCTGHVHHDQAFAVTTWSSQGRSPDGLWFDRAGRATYVLTRGLLGWQAVHSHHSIDPAAADGLARA